MPGSPSAPAGLRYAQILACIQIGLGFLVLLAIPSAYGRKTDLTPLLAAGTATLTSLAIGIGFLLRRNWARLFLAGECVIASLLFILFILLALIEGEAAGGVCAGSFLLVFASGAFVYVSPSVRQWTSDPRRRG